MVVGFSGNPRPGGTSLPVKCRASKALPRWQDREERYRAQPGTVSQLGPLLGLVQELTLHTAASSPTFYEMETKTMKGLPKGDKCPETTQWHFFSCQLWRQDSEAGGLTNETEPKNLKTTRNRPLSGLFVLISFLFLVSFYFKTSLEGKIEH